MKREQLAEMAVSPYGSWPRDEAEAFVVLSSASLPMAQALHERSTRYAASTHAICRQLYRCASWLKAQSALYEDPAPSARLVASRARGAPTHPGAQPEQVGGLPWPPHPASGRPKIETFPPPTTRRAKCPMSEEEVRPRLYLP